MFNLRTLQIPSRMTRFAFTVVLVSACGHGESEFYTSDRVVEDLSGVVYASPRGSGLACTEVDPCTLQHISVHARKTAPIEIRLNPGVYTVHSPKMPSAYGTRFRGFKAGLIIRKNPNTVGSVIFDGSIQNLSWTKYNTGSTDKHTFRTPTGSINHELVGWFQDDHKTWHKLPTYQRRRDLLSDAGHHRRGTPASSIQEVKPLYAGPGVWWDSININASGANPRLGLPSDCVKDSKGLNRGMGNGCGERAYVRLSMPLAKNLHGKDFGHLLSCARENNCDPEKNNPPLRLAYAHTVGGCGGGNNRFYGLHIADSSNVVVRDIDFRFLEVATRLVDTDNVRFDNVRFLVSRTAISGKRNKNVLINNITADAAMPPWVAWTDIKGNAARPTVSEFNRVFSERRGERNVRYCKPDGKSTLLDFFNGKSGPGASCSFWSDNIEVRNSRMLRSMDSMGSMFCASNIRIHHNFIQNRDDAVQLSQRSKYLEFHHNLVDGTAVSYGNADGLEKPADTGRKFIYGNVIVPPKTLWTRRDPSQQVAASYSGWRSGNALGSHSTPRPGRGDPWKIYGNTMVVDNRDVGVKLWKQVDAATGADHEVYNNIIVQKDGTAAFESGFDVRAKEQKYSHNVYWRPGHSTEPMWRKTTTVDVSKQPIASHQFSLVEFQSLGAGWESVGTVWQDPGFRSSPPDTDPRSRDYRPIKGIGRGKNLTTWKWPGIDGRTWRGACSGSPSNVNCRLVGARSKRTSAARVAFWGFDKEDLTDNWQANNGASLGGTFVKGRFGSALSFLASESSYRRGFVVPDAERLDVGEKPFTIMSWIKVDDRGKYAIAGRGYGISNNSWSLRVYDGLPRGEFIDTRGKRVVVQSKQALSKNKWAHVAMTVDRSSASGLKLYINGTETEYARRGDPRGLGAVGGAGDFGVGRLGTTTTSQTLVGSLDHVKLFMRVLTPDEIQHED